MVSHQLMLSIQGAMSEEPESLSVLSKRLKMHRPNVRRSLLAMVELGLVERIEIPAEPKNRVLWKRTV